MANVIGVMGDSGSGKTTSMRNLDPGTTMYVDCDKKGLSWKGWKSDFCTANKNYAVTDHPAKARGLLKRVNEEEQFKHIKVIVFDTINGLMVADEMRRRQEKNYDKWMDLAMSVYNIVKFAGKLRDDLTVIFLAHTETVTEDNGYMMTRIATSGRKLQKIKLETMLNTVLMAKATEDGYKLITKSDGTTTAKTPMGAFEESAIDNDISIVLDALKEY